MWHLEEQGSSFDYQNYSVPTSNAGDGKSVCRLLCETRREDFLCVRGGGGDGKCNKVT